MLYNFTLQFRADQMLSEDHWLRLGGCPGPNFAEFKGKVHLKMKCQSLSAHHHAALELGVVVVVIIKQTFLELQTKILFQHWFKVL